MPAFIKNISYDSHKLPSVYIPWLYFWLTSNWWVIEILSPAVLNTCLRLLTFPPIKSKTFCNRIRSAGQAIQAKIQIWPRNLYTVQSRSNVMELNRAIIPQWTSPFFRAIDRKQMTPTVYPDTDSPFRLSAKQPGVCIATKGPQKVFHHSDSNWNLTPSSKWFGSSDYHVLIRCFIAHSLIDLEHRISYVDETVCTEWNDSSQPSCVYHQ